MTALMHEIAADLVGGANIKTMCALWAERT